MELKDFVTSTLTQIAEGVKNAQEPYKNLGGVVNPGGLKLVEGGMPYGKTIPMHGDAILLCNVQFEVSLTSDNLSNNSGGIGVLFGAISIVGKSGEEERQSSLTKVKFNVPVKLPSH